jgi:hypothetical protein
MILGEVTIAMNDDGTICLRSELKRDLSLDCWDEVVPKDFSTVKTWDLSHNLLTSEVFVYGIVNKVKDKEWPNVEVIDLSYNHLSEKCVPQLWGWLRCFPNAKIKLGYNGITKDDLTHIPRDVRDRIDITTQYDVALDIVKGKLEKKWRELKDWQQIEDDVLEEELSRGTVAYYQSLGYKDVTSVNVSNIYKPDGNVLLELDGLVIAENATDEADGCDDKPPILATVESKHNLTEYDINKRKLLLSKFLMFLRELPDSCEKSAHRKYRMTWGMLNPLRDMTFAHFIGGVNIPIHIKNLAQKEGFHVLQYRGSRFDVAEPRKAFKPFGPDELDAAERQAEDRKN